MPSNDILLPAGPLLVAEDWDGKRPRVLVCRTTRFAHDRPSCGGRGSEALLKALQDSLQSAGLISEVDLIASPCLGYCTKGPNVRIAGKSLHHAVTAQDIPSILGELIVVINGDGSESPDAPEAPQNNKAPKI